MKWLAWSAATATFALIALGGVVRITGSGMGCGDGWPLCNGKLLPPLDPPTLIEYGHRLAATVVGVLVLALAALAWTRHREEDALRGLASFAAGLLLLQILLGAVTVRLELAAWTVVLHLATAMVLLTVLLVTALQAGERTAGASLPRTEAAPVWAGRTVRLARTCAGLAIAVILLGGLVASLGAGSACRGFPLCNGTLLPEGGGGVALQWLHRLLAFALVGWLGGLLAAGWGRLGEVGVGGRVARLSGAALALGLLQLGVAAAMVLSSLPPGLRAAHLVLGTLLWACLVVLCHEARHAVQPALGSRAASQHAAPTLVSPALTAPLAAVEEKR